MKAYAIVIKGNEVSEAAFERLQRSSTLDIERFDAIVPDEVNRMMVKKQIRWNYPWNGSVLDFDSGMVKTAYQTANPSARIACALSHYVLWDRCSVSSEPFLILEHDAIFVEPLPESAMTDFQASVALIASINNPLGATRKAALYHKKLQQHPPNIFAPVPTIDDDKIPQGLPGNSAYMIKPTGAQAMIDLVNEFGLWPNDAIMCKQLIHGLYCSTTYYTKVQGTPSTTTL